MDQAPSSKAATIPRRTRLALLWTGFLNEPLVALFSLMPFILRKDLKATAFQIALFTMLKPLVSVLSFYWSSLWEKGPHRLRLSLVGSWILSRFLFLFLPWCHSASFAILTSLIYLLFYRAGLPALMEILKVNLPTVQREKIFSLSATLNHALSIVIGIFIGCFLDVSPSAWPFLFFFMALLGFFAIAIQWRLPLAQNLPSSVEKLHTHNKIVGPWKRCFQLLKERPDFAQFQWSFMAGGIGLMMMAPAWTLFCADILSLSHTDMTISRFLCMGLGFAFTSTLWSESLSKKPILQITRRVCLLFSLFPILLIFSLLNPFFVPISFLFYGIAQAGSHLIWHLSGPLFSGESDSSPFTAVNILMVGLRGLVAPLIGCLLCEIFSPQIALIVGSLFCLIGAFLTRSYQSQKCKILK
jgi:hypothetical protein